MTNERASALAALLIRNFNDAPLERLVREPLYDSQGARLARGTAARKLGASIDILAPGKRGCPYHLHRAHEEMFVVLEGSGTQESPEIVEYPDSGKFLAEAEAPEGAAFDLIQKVGPSLDYWEGEP